LTQAYRVIVWRYIRAAHYFPEPLDQVLGEGIGLTCKEVIEIIGSGIYHRKALALRPRDGFSVMKLLQMIRSPIMVGFTASNTV
jgi:hypothetical protein